MVPGAIYGSFVVVRAGRDRVLEGGQASEEIFVVVAADPASDHGRQRPGQGRRNSGGHAFDLNELGTVRSTR